MDIFIFPTRQEQEAIFPRGDEVTSYHVRWIPPGDAGKRTGSERKRKAKGKKERERTKKEKENLKPVKKRVTNNNKKITSPADDKDEPLILHCVLCFFLNIMSFQATYKNNYNNE